jgi:hypothetical protein
MQKNQGPAEDAFCKLILCNIKEDPFAEIYSDTKTAPMRRLSFPVKSIHFCRFKKFQLILITFFFKAIL